jgi:hypothetical protein
MQQPAAAIDFILSLAHLGLGKCVERGQEPSVGGLELRPGYLDESPGLQSEGGHRSLSFIVDPADVLRRAGRVAGSVLDAVSFRTREINLAVNMLIGAYEFERESCPTS